MVKVQKNKTFVIIKSDELYALQTLVLFQPLRTVMLSLLLLTHSLFACQSLLSVFRYN